MADEFEKNHISSSLDIYGFFVSLKPWIRIKWAEPEV